jgi:hypothetical protein
VVLRVRRRHGIVVCGRIDRLRRSVLVGCVEHFRLLTQHLHSTTETTNDVESGVRFVPRCEYRARLVVDVSIGSFVCWRCFVAIFVAAGRAKNLEQKISHAVVLFVLHSRLFSKQQKTPSV